MKSLLYSFIILVALSMPFRVSGTNLFHTCRIIGQKDGLTSNKITCIAKDSLGTVWVGTSKGLNRIVENKVIRYSSPEFRNTSISFCFADANKDLWIGCSSGLWKYDYLSDSFVNVNEGREPLNPWKYALFDEGIIFDTADGIFMYRYSDGICGKILPRINYEIRYTTFLKGPENLAVVTVNSDGVYGLNLQSNELSLICKLDSEDNIKVSHIDNHGKLWLSVHNKGLYCIQLDDSRYIRKFNTENSGLTNNTVLDIRSYGDKVLLSTDGGGMCLLDPEEKKICPFADFLGYRLPDLSSNVMTMFCDDNGLWLGTVRHGLLYLYDSPILSMSLTSGSKSEEDSVIQCIKEDHQGNIWLGTDGGGMIRYEPDTGRFSEISTLKRKNIVAMEIIGDSSMMISSYNDGIYIYDYRKDILRKITASGESIDKHLKNDNITYHLLKRSDDDIYISGDNLYNYNISSNTLSSFNLPIKKNESYFKMARLDNDDILLYNGFSIHKFNNAAKEISKSYYNYGSRIQHILTTQGKILLLADYSIYTIDCDLKEAVRIKPTRYNGEILSITVDSNNSIWAATYDRLICMNGYEETDYRIFNINDGVAHNDYFYPDVNLFSSDSTLYFGGLSGLCMVQYESLKDAEVFEDIFLISVKVDGSCRQYVNEGKNYVVNIPWDYQTLEMNVTIDGTNVFRSNEFKYTIHGRDKVTEVLSDNILSLPVLSPGHYTIDISALDSSDKWIKVNNSIMVHVQPPWWRGIIFPLGITLLICITAFLYTFLYYRKEKRKSARVYEERKKKLTENKIRFLINVAHELRTPLTLIYAPVRRLLGDERVSDSLKKSLLPIYHQSMHMTRLINTLLDARKFEEGHGKLIVAPVEFNSWAKRVADDFRIEYEAKNMELRYEFDERTGTLNCDEGKCSIALSNLLMNAYKYSGEGTCVTIRTSLEEGYVRISVIDEGVGLENEDIEALFNRFEQAGHGTDGFGLGLSYTKQLIEAHPGGRISAFSNQESGSTFYFELPTDIPCDIIPLEGRDILNINETDNAGADTPISFDLSNLNILLVDDEPELLKFVRESLKGNFRKIFTARNGMEALNIAYKYQPDIIVSDVMMPEMNGYELCSRIKNDINISHIPIILLTAQTEITNRTEGYKSGADIFLPKPFDIPELLVAVKTLLFNRHIVRESFKSDFASLTTVNTTFSNADEQFMKKLNDFISANVSNDSIDATEIIDHMCMSRSAFYKKMKELTDLGVKSYISQIRMRIAADRLIKSADSISEVASSVGINDTRYFSRIFKNFYNDTPSGYRQKNRIS